MIIYFIEDGFLSSYGIRKYLLSHMRLFSLKNSHCYRLFLLYLLESYFKDWNFSPEFRKKQLISSENWEIISGPATIYIFTDIYRFNSLIGSRGIFTPQRFHNKQFRMKSGTDLLQLSCRQSVVMFPASRFKSEFEQQIVHIKCAEYKVTSLLSSRSGL